MEAGDLIFRSHYEVVSDAMTDGLASAGLVTREGI
jgi:hypothetical protein